MADTTPKTKNKVWKNKLKKPLPKWHVNQGSSNDCGPFCATIVANGIRDANIINPERLAREMEAGSDRRHYLLPQRIKGWATFPWGVANALRGMGFKARWRTGASLGRLQQNVDEDRPTIILIGKPVAYKNGKYVGWSHYKVVYAYDEDEFAFVDPMAKANEVYTYQDVESFKKQWSAMGRILIEAWDE